MGLSQQRISQIIGDTNISKTGKKAKLRPSDRIVACKRWIEGETQENIATDFEVSQQTISDACNQLINEITGRYKSGKHKWEVAEEYGLTEGEMDKILAKSGDPLNFSLPENTWWPSFGLDPSQVKFPGVAPLNLVKAVLAYFSKPGDHIVDPMAGSGTLGLACRDMVSRSCECFDLNPSPEPVYPITCHNLKNKEGNPNLPQCQKPDLVFLDPPYWRLKQDEYSQDGVAMTSYQEWLSFMKKLAKDSFKTLKPGGHIALFIESFLDERETGKFLFLNRDCLELFEVCGFEGIQEISLNMPSQIKSFRDVTYAKKKQILLDLKREVFVFRK